MYELNSDNTLSKIQSQNNIIKLKNNESIESVLNSPVDIQNIVTSDISTRQQVEGT